jgi:hypothetical protein
MCNVHNPLSTMPVVVAHRLLVIFLYFPFSRN